MYFYLFLFQYDSREERHSVLFCVYAITIARTSCDIIHMCIPQSEHCWKANGKVFIFRGKLRVIMNPFYISPLHITVI